MEGINCYLSKYEQLLLGSVHSHWKVGGRIDEGEKWWWTGKAWDLKGTDGQILNARPWWALLPDFDSKQSINTLTSGSLRHPRTSCSLYMNGWIQLVIDLSAAFDALKILSHQNFLMGINSCARRKLSNLMTCHYVWKHKTCSSLHSWNEFHSSQIFFEFNEMLLALNLHSWSWISHSISVATLQSSFSFISAITDHSLKSKNGLISVSEVLFFTIPFKIVICSQEVAKGKKFWENYAWIQKVETFSKLFSIFLHPLRLP